MNHQFYFLIFGEVLCRKSSLLEPIVLVLSEIFPTAQTLLNCKDSVTSQAKHPMITFFFSRKLPPSGGPMSLSKATDGYSVTRPLKASPPGANLFSAIYSAVPQTFSPSGKKGSQEFESPTPLRPPYLTQDLKQLHLARSSLSTLQPHGRKGPLPSVGPYPGIHTTLGGNRRPCPG